ncbi:coniferyl-aldehyde dehydrogenase [Pseudoalteromonas ruthenica]|uniref:Aldehyde dehydrogenase n=1 Tax=Pseudoalteromonas ruthenica TaxID=151081 RepID=A0A5S3Z4F8_9GAMM|nr:aldehyde dehydrogenase family protein [Pseudoalteromonas ruthenica]TMP86720.1 coniferyl-aldehyde dehydrogenase [Pseudoalteromonas ruthenica]
MSEQLCVLDKVFSQFKQAHEQEPIMSLVKRKQALLALKHALLDAQEPLIAAASEDFGYRERFDTLVSDILPTIEALDYCRKNLAKWAKPEKRQGGFAHFPSSLHVHYEAKGVVGVVSPWNYPVNLALSPLAFALAAGNRVVVKLSEYTPAVNQVLKTLLSSELKRYVAFIEGDAQVGAEFSAKPWDHLVFTGSGQIGKKVMRSAAENLTPVTLELGGKSPAVMLPCAQVNHAATQIAFGKSTNAGQICVAPDFVLLYTSQLDSFITCIKAEVAQLDHRPTKVINQAQANRLKALKEDAISKGAKALELINGGDQHVLTLLLNVDDSMRVCQEEIFGPLLPIQTYEHIEDACAALKAQPKPLALYLFATKRAHWQKVSEQVQSGTLAVNDTLMQVSATDLPFGGVGASGFGQYHGIEGFYTFSHARSVLKTPHWWPRAKLLLHRSPWLLKIVTWLYLKK